MAPVSSSQNPCRALVVHDDANIAYLLTRAMVGWGIEVTHVVDAGLARRWLEECPTPPRLVVVDNGLPGVGALGLCRYIREHWSADVVQVLVLTGIPDLTNGRWLLDSLATTWLGKPFRLEELERQVTPAMGTSLRASRSEDPS